MTQFDYIVVGAGSAGATLAARLSEWSDAQVLLLEAGPDYRSADTPEQFWDRNLGRGLALSPPRDEKDQEFFWRDIGARRNSHQDVFPYPRGRGMGGSSTVNGLCAIRGAPEDFAGWVRCGATGWSFDDMLPAFVVSESDHDFADAPYHGADGPTPVYREPESGWGGTDLALRDAALDTGYAWAPDHNDPASTGVSPFAMNIRDGRRVSTNDAYLEPNRERDNLAIRGDAHVDTVLFRGGRAVGVRLVGGERIEVATGGEVVLAAGAVHSPAILMRSGIGPADDLARLGLDVRCDLPVGRAAQDHAVLFVEVPVAEESQRCVGNRPTNIVVRYSSDLPGSGRNDMMLMASNHNYWFGKATAGVAVQLNESRSVGRLTVGSTDPERSPHLELNLLDHPLDLTRMRDGVHRVAELLAHRAFLELGTAAAILPEEDALLTGVKDVMHLCSTAPMGGVGDPRAVVDPHCRVIGVDNLRVVDASIMPSVVRANINLTVLAMAELQASRMTGHALPTTRAPETAAAS